MIYAFAHVIALISDDENRAAARKTFEETWRKVTPDQRGKYLNKLADLLERDIDIIANIEALDNGKSVTMAKGDVGAAAGCIRYYGGWADKIQGKVVDNGTETFNYIKKEPVRFRPPPGEVIWRIESY